MADGDPKLEAIDCWINPSLARKDASPAAYLFPSYAERQKKSVSLDEMLRLMDESSIEKGLFCYGYGRRQDEDKEYDKFILDAVERHPDRFALTVFVDPHKGMQALRDLDMWVKNYNCKAARLIAFATQRPYTDRIYYPVYAKCIELGIPVTCNVGIPGPKVPGEVQNPIYLDEVCWFYPELKVVMTHGGEPWAFLCTKLMLKWENLYYMTSAFAPKYYPPEIIQFMNSRGSDKVMFASDFPLVTFERCMREIKELPLRDDVRPKFLRENARRVFGI